MNAQEFVDTLEFPVVFFAGNGSPGGTSIAILDETTLPFDLDEVEGEINGDVFEATNLNNGSGLHGWQFSDFKSNIIYKIQVFSDKEIWERQNDEYNA